MKNQLLYVLLLLILNGSGVLGQPNFDSIQFKYIKASSLYVTTNKTTNLVFPSAIKMTDRGSADIIIQKAKNVDNVLQVKANAENFAETNLSVITEDGKLYSFLVNYVRMPRYLGIVINDSSESEMPIISRAFLSTAKLNKLSKAAVAAPDNVHLKTSRYRVALKLKGVYIADELMFLKLQLKNISDISYDVELIRLYLKDKATSRKTPVQEIDISPVLLSGENKKIAGRRKETFVVAIDKLTIPDKKILAIEVMEHHGGRHLKLRIQNRSLLQASILHSIP